MSEEMHNKIDLAIEQLEMAISLFLQEHSYVSALTLAGAAEEILGMAVKIEGIENSLHESYRLYCNPELSWLNPPKTWKDYTTLGKNRVRNAIKHLSNVDDLSFDADIQEEALWMIVRATDNYRRLGFTPTELMHQFDGWFYENVVGI
ncbi:hypothetical protein [uncultured Methylophaga sp.]|uniref:hypothetical protein n=1 Tax=uncultured Methylophaga sp. TaxID=285271 RepID=UPI0030D9700D|tara:strand:+ start:2639 stop:3082 length:444 start_codon:yes stop_codon:yes gene_type:complete